MKTSSSGIGQGWSALVMLVLLAGCGGGGGGGGGAGALTYSGNSSAAIVSGTNAANLAANLLGSNDAASVIVGLSITGDTSVRQEARGAMDLARRLSRTSRDTLARMEQAGLAQRPVAAGALEDGCDGGGTVSLSGTPNSDGTGTFTVNFANCASEGVTLNGAATLRVDAFFPQPIPTDFTLSFARITARGSGISVDAGGSLRAQLTLATHTETITENLVTLDNLTGGMTKTENLVFTTVYDNIFSPSSGSASINGRIFDRVHGFVDVTTLIPLFFSSVDLLFPNSGEILLTGGSNRRVQVKALSAMLVRLALDLNSDGIFEINATLKWTELSGPVGADLADSDGDGMHNSWETVYGPKDALADDDGDGFSNLSEYQGGGNPNDPSSVPSMLVGQAFTVAAAVSLANSNEGNPGRSAIASDGTNYLLVSCRDLVTPFGVFGVRISATGAVLDNFPISSETCPVNPAVAFDGTNYLVTWSRSGQIYGTRVTPDGAVLDAGGFAISIAGSNFNPALAFDGANYLVVWNKFVNGQYEIYGARVTPAGSAMAEFPVFTAAGEQIFPALAFDGTNYLVIWRDTRSGSGPSSDTDVFGTRVTPAGTVLDPLGIAIATASGVQEPGGIAFDGMNYLAVWNHEGKIHGRRIAQNGTLLDGAASTDGIAISTGPFSNHSSSVAFAGNTYVVTWGVGSFPNFPPAGIFSARVSKNGARIDGLPTELGVPISGSPPAFSRFVYPVVAPNGQSALISWVNNIELSGMSKDIFGKSVSGF